MKTSIAELGIGIATALLSVLLVTGALLMSLAEGRPAAPPAPETTATPGPSQEGTGPAAREPSPTISPTFTCPVPLGWQHYSVQPGDTLESLASQYGVTVEELSRRNCGFNGSLLPDSLLNLPPLPSVTPTFTITVTHTSPPTEKPATAQPAVPTQTPVTVVSCGLPTGWVIYVVQPGDTLFQIGLRYGVLYTELVRANCLTSTNIYSGQRLYVPNVITSTPRMTATNTRTATKPPAPTNTTAPTSTPETITPIPTDEPTDLPTPIPTAEPTDEPTDPPPTPIDTPVTPYP